MERAAKIANQDESNDWIINAQLEQSVSTPFRIIWELQSAYGLASRALMCIVGHIHNHNQRTSKLPPLGLCYQTQVFDDKYSLNLPQFVQETINASAFKKFKIKDDALIKCTHLQSKFTNSSPVRIISQLPVCPCLWLATGSFYAFTGRHCFTFRDIHIFVQC